MLDRLDLVMQPATSGTQYEPDEGRETAMQCVWKAQVWLEHQMRLSEI